MNMAVTPRILALGARSPLGLSALQVAMCARAQKLEPRSTEFMDRKNYRIGAARSVALSDELHGFDRFVALGAPALREASERLPVRAPLVLALPDRERPDQSARFEGELIAALAKVSGVAIDHAGSTTVRANNAGFGIALEEAKARLTAGAPAVLVGAIDSYFDPSVLSWLDEDLRLHSQHSESGIVPSEGAAFFLLTRPDLKPGTLGQRAPKPIATIPFVGSAHEETVVKGEPNLAVAMTTLARSAIAASKSPIAWIITDVNGERHRVREASLVELRILGDVAITGQNEAFARDLGDVGAATGALHLAVALARLRAGATPSKSALFMNYAEGPERVAFLMEEA